MASPPLVSHPSPSSSSDVEEEEAEPEAKVARLCSGEQLCSQSLYLWNLSIQYLIDWVIVSLNVAIDICFQNVSLSRRGKQLQQLSTR